MTVTDMSADAGQPPFTLSDHEADAIAELFNIGMGPPAASLSEMIGEEVILSVPALALSTRASIARELDPEETASACAVRGAFSGPFSGEAMLVFPDHGTLALVGRLVPVEPGTEAPGEMEQDVLTEIGNIILNGCLASLSNLIESEIAGGLPGYAAGPPARLIGTGDDPVLFVRIDVAVASGDASGHVLFLLDIASLDAFREAIRRTVENLGKP